MLFKLISLLGWTTSVSIVLGLMPVGIKCTIALPPPEDIPEEVWRTEIIIEARSPVDGKSLTAAEYADLQAQLQERAIGPQLNPKVKETIILLRLRRVIRTILPFLPI